MGAFLIVYKVQWAKNRQNLLSIEIRQRIWQEMVEAVCPESSREPLRPAIGGRVIGVKGK